MKRRHSRGVLCLTLAAQLTLGAGLSSGAALRGSPSADEPIASNAEIHAKWDKMDEFLKIMFQIACKWKHGEDVRGETREQLKNGDTGRDDVENVRKEIQARNVQDMNQACGKITASFKGKCRQGCSDRWGDAMVKRSECDGKCVNVYDSFQKNCEDKAANLKEVYEMSIKDAAARKQCHEGNCAAFPTVWMKSDKAEMEAARDKGCKGQCTADGIKNSCQKKWLLQADFVASNVTSSCFEKGGAKDCFDKEKTTASTEQETCSSEGKTGCTTQFDECKTAGKTDASHPDAEAFCTERKKMCESQVVESCLAKFKAGLDAAQKSCESKDSGAQKKCEDEGMAKKEKSANDKCVADQTPKCTEDCNKKCDVAAMDGCLANLKSEYDPTTMFCGELWHVLHQSSEIDPVTGDPIVFLASNRTGSRLGF